MDNIPEFIEPETEYDRLKVQYDRLIQAEASRHGSEMFANGVEEGLRQAIHIIRTAKTEIEPSGKWPGMNAAIVAIESAIANRKSK